MKGIGRDREHKDDLATTDKNQDRLTVGDHGPEILHGCLMN